MDTRATAHLYSEIGTLQTISDRKLFSFVLVGDGSKILSSKREDTDLSYINPYPLLSLKNVLITPNIIKNLLYVHRFSFKHWCSIKFDPFGFSVKDLPTKQALL